MFIFNNYREILTTKDQITLEGLTAEQVKEFLEMKEKVIMADSKEQVEEEKGGEQIANASHLTNISS